MSEPIQGIKVVLRFPDGRVSELVIDADRVIVGSGGHCEVRLPHEMAAVEHVSLTIHGTGVHAQARVMKPLPTINGSGFTQTPVAPDAVIGVGPVTIWASQI